MGNVSRPRARSASGSLPRTASGSPPASSGPCPARRPSHLHRAHRSGSSGLPGPLRRFGSDQRPALPSPACAPRPSSLHRCSSLCPPPRSPWWYAFSWSASFVGLQARVPLQLIFRLRRGDRPSHPISPALAAGIVAGAHEDALSNAALQDLHWIRGGTVTMRRLSAALLVLAPLTLAACSTLSVESEAHLLQPAPALTRTLVVVELSGESRRIAEEMLVSRL